MAVEPRREWASLDLHLEEIKANSKYGESVKILGEDMEHLLITSESLLKLASDMLR
jgi:hypothetical protein